MTRRYYSARKLGRKLQGDDLAVLVSAIYQDFSEKDYFVEAFGYFCVDADFVPGFAGQKPELFFVRKLRKNNLWPISEKIKSYTEDDIFDVIELLYDVISKPVDGTFHSYNGCGMHWESFDRAVARAEFRQEINDVLADYKDGFELGQLGEIESKGEPGLESLLQTPLPVQTDSDLRERLEEAIHLYRMRRATLVDRHNAVRMLADIFEKIRPRLDAAISNADERDLFNIANNFGIRHFNDKQKSGYDRALWLSWMFYHYVSTLHLVARKLWPS